MSESRQVVVWVPPNQRPRDPEEVAREARLKAATDAAERARLLLAKVREYRAEAQALGAEIAVVEMRKWLRLAASPDFQETVGPLSPEQIIKLFEATEKSNRLDQGQSTENIDHSHTVGPANDFSKLSQEERNQWRQLAVKMGAGSDE